MAPCSYPGCNVKPACFNFGGEEACHGDRCKNHKVEGMINVNKDTDCKQFREKKKAAQKAGLDTQKIGYLFEIAVAEVLGIAYNKPRQPKYQDLDSCALLEKFKARINDFVKEHWGQENLYHEPGQHSPHDFSGPNCNLSVKTNKAPKSQCKICPTHIGQSKKNLCNVLGLGVVLSDEEMKSYIVENVPVILSKMFEHTFLDNGAVQSQMLYYRLCDNFLCKIVMKGVVNWQNYDFEFSHIKNNKVWNSSSVLRVKFGNKFVNLVEFQFHKNRPLKMRWFVDGFFAFLDEADNIEVTRSN